MFSPDTTEVDFSQLRVGQKVEGTLGQWQLEEIFGMARGHLNGVKEEFSHVIFEIAKEMGMECKNLDQAEELAHTNFWFGNQVIRRLAPRLKEAEARSSQGVH